MKKEWISQDHDMFHNNRFLSFGLSKYWASINAAFRHWDTIVLKNKKKFNDYNNTSIYGKPSQIGRNDEPLASTKRHFNQEPGFSAARGSTHTAVFST